MALVLAVALFVGQVAGDEVSDDAGDYTPQPTPHEYLYQNYPGLASKLDCMIYQESRWQAGAAGAGGRYIGLAQFDVPTWYSTPQGKAGLSRYDPYASIDAMAWGVVHLGYRRWPVTSRIC